MTLKNPMQRFAYCKLFRQDKGCNFFEWVDEPLYDRVKSLVGGLMVKNETMGAEIDKLGKIIGD